MAAHLKQLCYTGKDIFEKPAVIDFDKKYPLSEWPENMSINIADPSTIGTLTFLDEVVSGLPQQASLLQQSGRKNTLLSVTKIVQTEAEQSTSCTSTPDNATRIANLTALPNTTKARDDVFQSISPIVRSRMNSSPASDSSSVSAPDLSSSDGDDENEDGKAVDALPKWLQKPADFPKKDDIWQLLYNFGLEYAHSFKTRKGYSIFKKTNNYDYVMDIINLINLEKHTHTITNSMLSDDFQIVTPEGYTWSTSELKEAISPLIEITSPKMAVCKAPVCGGKCDFATPRGDMPTRRHIIDNILGITFFCIKCGLPFNQKSNVVEHSIRCMYKKRTAWENLAVRDHYKEYNDPQKTKKGKTEHPDPVPIIEKMEEKFIDFCKLAFEQFRVSGLIPIAHWSEFRKYIKNNLDYNFFVFFKELIAPAAYGEKVCHLEDTGHYYGIFLCNKLTKFNKNPRKSLKFRILSKRDCKYTSIHTLTSMRADIISDDKTTCYIDGCVCKNTFTTEDAKYLVGHILEKNYMLVCEGCHRGIADWTFFLDHPTEACFIERPMRKK